MAKRRALVIVLSLACISGWLWVRGHETPEVASARLGTSFYFEPNHGQTNAKVEFFARTSAGGFFLTPSEAVATVQSPDDDRAVVLRMRFIGAHPDVHMAGRSRAPGQSNYLIGSRDNWKTSIPHFAEVAYEELYPGIDLVFYGNESELEYDFIVAPGAHPESIRLAFEGVEGMSIVDSGDLVLDLEGGSRLVQRAPLAYQGADESRTRVESGYAIFDDGKIGFEIGPYDARLPLTIDPVLVYSTYLGSTATDHGAAIAVDPQGSAYVVGHTVGSNFPTHNALYGSVIGATDVFVSKFDSSGSGLAYSTYLGGAGTDRAWAIAVDSSGNAYITGETGSSDFPTISPIDASLGNTRDAFLLKLSPDGSGVVYSTYIGGSGNGDIGRGVVVDDARSAYVVGVTNSSDFPTSDAFDGAIGGTTDAFITKVNSAGSAMIFSTFLGGSIDETAYAVALDTSSNVYVTGRTGSYNFPTVNPVQGQSTAVGSIFATKINSAGSALTYSTYLGGSGADFGMGVAVDNARNAYIAGHTNSTDFPTVNPLDSTMDGSMDAFLLSLNPSGSALVFSTYFGGLSEDKAKGIGLDSAGNVYFAGYTYSTDFPTVKPVQLMNGGGYDAFVAAVRPDGSAVLFSSYLGGSSTEYLSLSGSGGIALDDSGVYLTGETDSADFPTQFAFQKTRGSAPDAFVVKLSPALDFFIAAAEVPTPRKRGDIE